MLDARRPRPYTFHVSIYFSETSGSIVGLFIYKNIAAAPAYEVYTSHMIRYSRAGGSYNELLYKGSLLTRELLVVRIKSSLQRFYGCHHDFVNSYRISVSQMTTDMFCSSYSHFDPFLMHDLSQGL
jgi:hypothetical protein